MLLDLCLFHSAVLTVAKWIVVNLEFNNLTWGKFFYSLNFSIRARVTDKKRPEQKIVTKTHATVVKSNRVCMSINNDKRTIDSILK